LTGLGWYLASRVQRSLGGVELVACRVLLFFGALRLGL